MLIIEIDEFVHASYPDNEICENRRLMELSQDLNHRPLIVFRFNPDSYKENGEKIEGCWKISSTGLCIVPAYNKKRWKDRLYRLAEEIRKWIPVKEEYKTLETIHLFYGNNNLVKIEPEETAVYAQLCHIQPRQHRNSSSM